MDVTAYKALIEAKKSEAERTLFESYSEAAQKSLPKTLGKIEKMFPLFWGFFGAELIVKGQPVWLHSERKSDNAMGNPGVLLNGLIFAPYRDSDGYGYLNVGLYNGWAPAKEVGLAPKGREDKLANYIEQLNREAKDATES